MDSNRRTKIVATLGPRSGSPDVIRSLIDSGVDVARLNFSHGDTEQHRAIAHHLRAQARAAGRIIGILADLPGLKMRTGPIADDEVVLEAGRRFVLTAGNTVGDSQHVATTVGHLHDLVAPNDEIFLADGEIVLRVTGNDGADVETEVVRGGVLRSRKGMHVPGVERRVASFTEADQKALDLALEIGVDFVGLSFVRDGDDVRRVRNKLEGKPAPMIVAKIETRTAVENLESIADAADVVMVARGDLGIQTPLTRVPLLQKEIIRWCNRAGVPVITATQMLESMTDSPLPTRAEVADVANAVVDGTDALMLSEETAVGSYPVDAVTTMAATALTAESWPNECDRPDPKLLAADQVSWAVAHAAVQAAEDSGVAAIVCPTRTGSTALRVSMYRPSMPVVGLSKSPETAGIMAMFRGVIPLAAADPSEPRDAREDVERSTIAAVDAGLVRSGELVAVVAGSPGPRAGRTDYVRLVRA